jgi:hypothetical protein
MKDENKTEDAYMVAENIEHMIEAYVGAEPNYEARSIVVEQLATELGKSVVSIRAKLKALGVYEARVIAKPGNVITKDRLAEKIATISKDFYGVNIADGEVESLTKANKSVLRKLITMLEERKDDYSDTVDDTEGEEEIGVTFDAYVKG